MVTVAKNLGFLLDSTLTLDPQIKKLKATVCHKFRKISKMRPFLSEKQLQIITQSLVISSLDYCNALYIGANQSVVKRLQSLQNRAARIIKGLKRKDNVELHLKELHWLKVRERVEFKILLLTFKCIHGLAPKYLCDLIQYSPSCGRNVNLHCPSLISSMAFSVVAPKLWNDLPLDIQRTADVDLFKNKLKSHLFRKCYGIYYA